VSNIVEYESRAARKVQLYCADADDCTVLRVSDTYRIESSSRVLSKLRAKWSYVIGGARVEKPAGSFFRCSRTFVSVKLFTMRMFGSSSEITPSVQCALEEVEPQKFTSSIRFPTQDFMRIAMSHREEVKLMLEKHDALVSEL
jgi:hypothetical protein